MKTLILILSLCPLILAGQSRLEKKDQQVARIDPRSTEDFFKYVFDYEVIALGSEETLVLPPLRMIAATGDRFFATTKSLRRNPVYLFREDGSLIKSISKAGRGPGEYQGIRGVIPYTNGNFGLEDVSGQKILIFDSTGNYKQELKWTQLTYGIIGHNAGYFALLPEDMRERYGKIGLMNERFELDTGFLSNPLTDNSRIASGNELQALPGGFAYMEPGTTGIYHGNDREIWPAYYFDFGPYAPVLTDDGIPSFNNKVSLLTYYETENCIYLQYAFGMKNYILSVYSKRDGLVTNHRLKQLIGEELPGLSVADDLWMYLPIPAPAVPDLLKRLGLSTATFANGLSAKEVLDSENPVILKFRFF